MPNFAKNTSPFRMKGWSPFKQKTERKTTRGTGKTYEQRWKELTPEQKEKFGSLERFSVKGELYHSKKDIEFRRERQEEFAKTKHTKAKKVRSNVVSTTSRPSKQPEKKLEK